MTLPRIESPAGAVDWLQIRRQGETCGICEKRMGESSQVMFPTSYSRYAHLSCYDEIKHLFVVQRLIGNRLNIEEHRVFFCAGADAVRDKTGMPFKEFVIKKGENALGYLFREVGIAHGLRTLPVKITESEGVSRIVSSL